jgi:hypothetical protein
MKWMIRNNNYYWSTILEDCFKYYKGCQECQKIGSIQRVPASAMNPIIKPWTLRGWAIDLIRQIYPPSSKGHKFILVATDYFTKWVEAIPIKNVTSGNMIDFVKEHIVYWFGIPQTITTNQGSQFTSREFEEYANSLGIKLLNSSLYYAQANGQAKAANKGIIKLIKRKIDENPKWWHTILNETLWAYRMACHGATKVSPYQLVYGHDDVLPWELKTGSRRTSLQDQLSLDDYSTMMKEELKDLTGIRLRALENIEKNKKRIARWYDKKVKVKDFVEGDLVWKLILPIGSRDPKYGKWSLIEEKLIQHRLRWFGHVQRRPPEAPVRSGVLERVDNVKRGRGQPKLTWDGAVKRDLKEWNIPKELAMDRSAWRLAISVPEP